MTDTFLRQILSVFSFMMLSQVWGYSQENVNFQWINPVDDPRIIFYGQGWDHSRLKSPYDRLPSEAEENVREPVWGLSRHTAGIYLRFSTDADEILIRYQANSRYQMPHMPATGVSGLDMYVKSSEESWVWCRGKYAFNDTITYRYSNLNSRNPDSGAREYNLYLPLYNSVKWMEIGIPEAGSLLMPSAEKEKPILVYGTSIAQGGCASRPAMGWTNIVQRHLDRPVINLAFSGNGRLEEEVIAYIEEVDAGLYILDCLPNLGNKETYTDEELKRRIEQSVRTLRNSHPETPILLASHAGYSDDQVNQNAFESVERVNRILEESFHSLKKDQINHLYLLHSDEINMCMDCTVDGTHQTDLGMQFYADAYLKKIREILR